MPGSAKAKPLPALDPVALTPGEEWSALRGRSEVWIPLAAEALDRAGLRLDDGAFLGPGGSYPAVVTGELVVKFFGFEGEWRATWENERRAQERLAVDARILAPRLVGAGELFPAGEQSIPYLILTRIPGESWCDVPLSFEQQRTIAEALGEQLRLVHALPCDDLPDIETWCIKSVSDGARSGAFPAHLVHQIERWLETVPIEAPTFVHSDIFDRHPFVCDGRLSGIIDWGDAMAADPHVELGKVHLDVFAGDKRLLRAFLDAYGWPVDADFPRRCLAMALRRHAQIHGQHGPGGDVFYRVPDLLAGGPPRDLDTLAHQLFAP